MGYKYKRVSGKHTPYHRYVWEQAHPGESAEGMVIIFLDGDRENFSPENLERVSRAELGVMAKMGNRDGLCATERKILLLRARIAIAKSKLAGSKEAAALHRKEWYRQKRQDPEFNKRRAEYAKKHMAEVYADPARHEEYLRKQRARREANRERYNEYQRQYKMRKRNGE